MGERVETKGYVDLYTKLGGEMTLSKTIKIRYLIVDAKTSYNVLLGRPSLNALEAIVFMPHLAMKFPSSAGDIVTIHVDQKITRECYVASLKVEPPSRVEEEWSGRGSKRNHVVAVTDLDPRLEEVWVEPHEETRLVPLARKEKTTRIGTSLTENDNESVIQMLQQNATMFAWTSADMSGVDPNVIMHRLSIFKDAKPVT